MEKLYTLVHQLRLICYSDCTKRLEQNWMFRDHEKATTYRGVTSCFERSKPQAPWVYVLHGWNLRDLSITPRRINVIETGGGKLWEWRDVSYHRRWKCLPLIFTVLEGLNSLGSDSVQNFWHKKLTVTLSKIAECFIKVLRESSNVKSLTSSQTSVIIRTVQYASNDVRGKMERNTMLQTVEVVAKPFVYQVVTISGVKAYENYLTIISTFMRSCSGVRRDKQGHRHIVWPG